MCAMSVDLHAMANEAGLEAPDYFAEELNGLDASEREGLVDIEDHLVRVTVSRVLTRFKRRGSGFAMSAAYAPCPERTRPMVAGAAHAGTPGCGIRRPEPGCILQACAFILSPQGRWPPQARQPPQGLSPGLIPDRREWHRYRQHRSGIRACPRDPKTGPPPRLQPGPRSDSAARAFGTSARPAECCFRFEQRAPAVSHGGQIDAEPNPAGGTVFRFTLRAVTNEEFDFNTMSSCQRTPRTRRARQPEAEN
jgi:hypothetical protein